jgi:hypothetical protein
MPRSNFTPPRTFDEGQDLDEIEATAAAGRGDLERSHTLHELDGIVLSVQPMHKNDSMTRLSEPGAQASGGDCAGGEGADCGGRGGHALRALRSSSGGGDGGGAWGAPPGAV